MFISEIKHCKCGSSDVHIKLDLVGCDARMVCNYCGHRIEACDRWAFSGLDELLEIWNNENA